MADTGVHGADGIVHITATPDIAAEVEAVPQEGDTIAREDILLRLVEESAGKQHPAGIPHLLLRAEEAKPLPAGLQIQAGEAKSAEQEHALAIIAFPQEGEAA